MPSPLRTALLVLVGLVLGSGAGLFLVGVGLFADGSMTERYVLLGISLVAFAAIGAVLGWFAGRAWLWTGLALGTPPVVLAVLLGENGVLTAAYAFCTFAAGMGAVALVSGRRRTRA